MAVAEVAPVFVQRGTEPDDAPAEFASARLDGNLGGATFRVPDADRSRLTAPCGARKADDDE